MIICPSPCVLYSVLFIYQIYFGFKFDKNIFMFSSKTFLPLILENILENTGSGTGYIQNFLLLSCKYRY